MDVRQKVLAHRDQTASVAARAMGLAESRRPKGVLRQVAEDAEASAFVAVYVTFLHTTGALEDVERQKRIMRDGIRLAQERIQATELEYDVFEPSS